MFEKATRAEIESALDNRQTTIWTLMRSGRYWELRRNGKTQTWKREPYRFRIPVKKAGLKSYSEITEDSDVARHAIDNTAWREADFVITPRGTNPNV